jgi:aminoglycoside 6'-N-acetyltransferase I
MLITYPLLLDGGLSNELERQGDLNQKLWSAKFWGKSSLRLILFQNFVKPQRVNAQATDDNNTKKKMTVKTENITFGKLDKDNQIPYKLLLLADPSKELVDEYLKPSDIYVARQNGETLGVIVLFPLTTETVEIKNVAVKPEFQGQGIGSFLIENAIQVALLNKQISICIGTANSSVGQLFLYQKLGFEIIDIKRHFFTDNYVEPIYENGIQAKHMLVLTRQLK